QRATGEARGLFLLEFMKESGFAASTFAPEDMRLGRDLLRALASDPGIALVSTNLYDEEEGELLLPPYTIVERAGLRIGITAASAPMEEVRRLAEEAGMRFEDPADRLPGVLQELDGKTDMIVLLARMELEDAEAIAMESAGLIDVVVMGGQKSGRGGRSYRETGGATYVVAGNRGQALGVARVAIDGREVQAVVGEELVLSRDWPENPEVLASVTEFQRNLNEMMKEHAVTNARSRQAPDGHYYLGAENCASCHVEEYRRWLETPHSDAFQTLVDVDSEALPECFQCHVTGHGDAAGYIPFLETETPLINVQCEVCHGKGTEHARDGSYGKSLLMESCATCHDPENSPDFDPEVYWLMMEH
ncbi:MAG: hypothetical protein HKN12_06200, partial [Gemmatimonadetes bacterium]|nr:hypothetical protein [Gemmatimonadota bacterium]